MATLLEVFCLTSLPLLVAFSGRYLVRWNFGEGLDGQVSLKCLKMIMHETKLLKIQLHVHVCCVRLFYWEIS